ncbi:MAG: hypothetical protein ACRDRN_22700 [Sciscionella sp.]
MPGKQLVPLTDQLTFGSLNIQATHGIADDEQGLAGGLLNTSVQVGGAVVLAAATAVLTANGGEQASSAALLSGVTPTLSVVAGVALLGMLIALTGVRSRRPAPVEDLDAELGREVDRELAPQCESA